MTNYSNSYIKRYQQCPLACYYHNELRLRKREEGGETHHMAFSKAFHSGLQRIYLGDTLRAAQEAFLEGYPRQLDESDLAKTRQNGVLALAQYVSRWREEDKQYKVLACETLDNQDDGFVVKLDLVLQHVETEQIFNMDHKVTKKYLNYDYWAGFEPDSQIVEYNRYTKERFGFCDGFIVNAVSLNWISEKDKRGSFNGFWLKPDDPAQHGYSQHERRFSRYHKQDMVACWGLRTNFERQTFNVNERQMQADLSSRHYWTERIEHSKTTGLWGMNTSQCKFCEYRDLCKAGWFYPEDSDLIDINYRRICGRWFGEPLQPCVLDRDHEGDHSPFVQDDASIEIEVEV